jgi:PAT family beta-lactamase induction signal transducer AmpG
MPALSESRLLRFAAFTLLYLAQGLPWGFIAVGYVVLLADAGASSADVGVAMGMAYLPWSFKILAGPLLDLVPRTRFGRRRPFIVAAELLMGLTLLSLLFFDPSTDLYAIGVVLFLHNTAAAVQDVAVDALAVDLLEEEERGRANSFMWAGKSAGVALGGGGGTVLAGIIGWNGLFVVLALAVWGIMLVPLLCAEFPPGEDGVAAPADTLDFDTLRQSFGFATPWLGLLVAFATPAGYAMIGPVLTRMMRADLGFTDVQIGTVSGMIEPMAGVLGALIGGFLADRFGVRAVMGTAMAWVAVMLVVFGFGETLWPSFAAVAAWTVLFNLGVYAYNAASLGYFMSLSNPAIGATQFAGFMAATNLCYTMVSPLGGQLADSWGVGVLFLFAGVVQVSTIPLLLLANPATAVARYAAVGAVPASSPAG